MARYLKRVSGLSLVVLLASTAPAFAAPAAGTAGAILASITTSVTNLPNIFSAAAYILGLLFAMTGVFKFKDHVDNPQQTPISAGVKRMIAGGMLFATPFMAAAVQGTLDGGGGTAIGGAHVHGSAGLTGMDLMITQFIGNIAAPAIILLEAFAYIGAIALLIVGIIRLTKTAQEGPRGPAGLGTLMTFIASGALFSFSDMAGIFSNSLFGTSTVATFSSISTTVITAADAAQVEPVIDSVMVFVMIVGLIAFVRGLFVLKSFADGNTQTSLAQALTFLIGGTMAINLGQLINFLEKTVGVTGLTFS